MLTLHHTLAITPIARQAPPPETEDAMELCAHVQYGAAEQIDASLLNLLKGLMAMTQSRAARWSLEDASRAGPPITVAEVTDGDWQPAPLGRDQGLVRIGMPIRQTRTMFFELQRSADQGPLTTEQDHWLTLTLNGLGRWLHWLDLSHGPVTAQGPMPPHQRKVLLLLITGLSEKQIAAQLDISVNTAHQYVTALFRRYGVRNRPSLMARWLTDVPFTAPPSVRG